MDVHSRLHSSLSDAPEPDSPRDSSSVKVTPRYSIEAITTEEGLSSLEEDWNRLSQASEEPNVFMTFDWFRAWDRCFSRGDRSGRRPNVLVLKKGGAIVGISPLIYRRASCFGVAVRKLEFAETLADYHDLALGNDPLAPSQAIANFLADTQNEWDLIDLRDVRNTGKTLALIEIALARAGLPYRVLADERCPHLPIRGDSATQFVKLFGHVPRTIRKQTKRARALGLRTRVIESPQDEPGLLDKIIALEAQKRVDGQLRDPFLGRYKEVFQLLFDTLGPRGWIYVALLELNDRAVAFQLGFRCGKKLWDYQTAFDRSFSSLSPGTMLLPTLLDYGFSHGYNEYDFLRGVEAYKIRWSTSFHQTYRLLIWGSRRASRAQAFAYLELKPVVYHLLGKKEEPK